MRLGVVITAPTSRQENLRRTIEHLARTDPAPRCLAVVGDGWDSTVDWLPPTPFPLVETVIPKHSPGQEQPRNVGVRTLREQDPDLTHVWFLDSDLIFKSDVLAAFERAYSEDPVTEITAPARTETQRPAYTTRVLVGPYEWLAPEQVDMPEDLRTDIRWPSFNDHGPNVALVHDLGAALACFGGNLVWPIDEFQAIGGFHGALSHGRVEDGELGLRAAAAGIPMTLVRDARAWHVAHQVNGPWQHETNAREVPLLNAWHPTVQDGGYILTEADGARFDWRCTEPDCDLIINSHDVWRHVSDHKAGRPFTFNDPASVRHAT